jgi:3-deoxy-manno-octulosonate cytidylyltransferase (CMP-KDO synthetase)
MGLADRVVVATDADAVAAVARAAGAQVAMTRADHPSGTDRVAEVARQPAYRDFGIIVNVQGDEPYIDPDAVRGAVKFVTDGTYPIGTAASPAAPDVLANPAVVKVVTDLHGRALYFSRAPIPFLRDEADRTHRDPLVKQHLGLYAYTRPALERWVSLPPHPIELTERLEQLRALMDGLAIGVATIARAAAPGIDTEEELALANARWSEETRVTRSDATTTPTVAGAH